MTDASTGSRRYDDEEFLEVLDVQAVIHDDWVGTATVATIVGCSMGTANDRLLDLAAEEDIELYDPEAGDGDLGEAVDLDSIDRPTRRLLGFRRPPDDPDSAPEHLTTRIGKTV